MTFVVTSNCKDCRFTDCVEVCPADCFHGDEEMLYINPRTCICCGACVPQCPVEAIFTESAVPTAEEKWLRINAERAPRLPVILSRRPARPTAKKKARDLGFSID